MTEEERRDHALEAYVMWASGSEEVEQLNAQYDIFPWTEYRDKQFTKLHTTAASFHAGIPTTDAARSRR